MTGVQGRQIWWRGERTDQVETSREHASLRKAEEEARDPKALNGAHKALADGDESTGDLRQWMSIAGSVVPHNASMQRDSHTCGLNCFRRTFDGISQTQYRGTKSRRGQ